MLKPHVLAILIVLISIKLPVKKLGNDIDKFNSFELINFSDKKSKEHIRLIVIFYSCIYWCLLS